jgi:hypothetical protein
MFCPLYDGWMRFVFMLGDFLAVIALLVGFYLAAGCTTVLLATTAHLYAGRPSDAEEGIDKATWLLAASAYILCVGFLLLRVFPPESLTP